jgi:uncharacterized protein YcnI
MMTSTRHLTIATTLGVLLVVQGAFAHVTISPRESPAGATETYSMRVPTERDSATIRIEAEFPMGLTVSGFEPKDGWTVEPTTNADGHVVNVVWSGGSILQEQAEAFTFTVQNPGAATTLVWRVIQTHADGSTAEWVGEADSRNPAPRVVIGSN